MISHQNIYKILLINVLFLFFSCKSEIKHTDTASTELENNNVVLNATQLKNASLEYGNLISKSISTTIKVNGVIDVPPQNLISISMPMGGYLKTTKLIPGMHLVKGEIIAILEDQQYIQLQQDYLTTKSKLYAAEKEYQRQRDLNSSQASSDKVYQTAEMDYNVLKIGLNSLAEKLKLININPMNLNEGNISKNITIRSPINGFVSKVNVNIGKYVSPADVLFELIDPSDIHLNLKVFEKDLVNLFIGQKVMTFTNMNPKLKHPCKIILISKNLSENHTADIHCHFEDYDKTLLPGMYMNADIELENRNSMCLPEEAVVNYEGKSYIFVEKSNNKNVAEFEIIQVETGTLENGYLEILNSQILEEKNIVTKGAYTLLMKMKNTAEE